MPGTGPIRRNPTGCVNFRTYFITLAANPYTTMHYNIGWLRSSTIMQHLQACGQDP